MLIVANLIESGVDMMGHLTIVTCQSQSCSLLLPEEIAAVVHYLSSPDCSFVTGQCHDASGGRATY